MNFGTKWASLSQLLFTLAICFPNGLWIFELLQAFSMHYLVLNMCFLVVSIFWKSKRLTISSIISCGILVLQLYPFVPINQNNTSTSNFKVGVFNVFHENTNYSESITSIINSECDLISVLEVSNDWDKALNTSLSKSHPYSVTLPHANCCYGLSVYSRFPIVSDTIIYCEAIPLIKIRIEKGGSPVDIWTLHTLTPAFPNNTTKRNFQMITVARQIVLNNTPAILVGDLNIVPWAQDFQSMKTISGMTESRKGFLATYPMDFGIPLIPIDHILHSKHFSTAFCATVVLPGSDHKGLIAGLNWN